MSEGSPADRVTFSVIDVVEILEHWYSGRSKTQVAQSLGVDRATVAKYVAPAEAAGLVPGGSAISEEAWRAKVREWFPAMIDTRLRQPSWDQIALHHERIKALLGVVPVSVIHQRLADEDGLEASVASLRRYVRAHFDEAVRREGVAAFRPPVDPGDEALCGKPHSSSYVDPANMRRRYSTRRIGAGQRHGRGWADSR